MRLAPRRVALLTALGFAATSVGFSAGPAAAAGCPDPSQSCLVVTVVSTKDFTKTSKQYVFTASQINSLTDLTAPKFTTRNTPGGKVLNEPRPAKALSLREILKQIGVKDPAQADLVNSVTFSETPGSTGVPSVLDKPAFGEPVATNPDFPYDDDLPPAIYMSAGKPVYFRPLSGEDDVNRPDRYRAEGRMDLTIHTSGKLLAPTATVDKSNPTTKDAPQFSVSFGTKPGTQLKYRWDFGDARGPDRAEKSPSHKYKTKGTYGAYVSVFGADGSYGRSQVLSIKVAKPPKPTPTPKAPTTGTGGGLTGGTGGYVPPYDPPTTTLPLPDPVEPSEDLPTPDAPPVDDGLQEVEGFVLAGAEIVPGGTPEAIPGTQASSQPTPASTTSTRKRVATWTVAALGILLLVGAGAASETRWVRNQLRHLRRRA